MSNSKHNKTTIIFDFDGTIADTFQFYLTVLNQLSKKFGFKSLPLDQADSYKNHNSHEMIEFLEIPKIKMPFIVWEARNLLKSGINQILPFTGIKKVIEEIRKIDGIMLGILTSNSVKNVKLFLKEHHFPDFDFIFSSIQIWNKSKILKRILHHHKLESDRVFYVGDETRDIEAVKEAGIKSIAVTWGYNSKELLQSFSPDYLVTKPQEMKDIISGLIK